jgi:hypothetical protein
METPSYLKDYPKEGNYWILNNQYLPNGFGRPAASYYYIVDAEGRIFHHHDSKWRKKALINVDKYWFHSEQDARDYVKVLEDK